MLYLDILLRSIYRHTANVEENLDKKRHMSRARLGYKLPCHLDYIIQLSPTHQNMWVQWQNSPSPRDPVMKFVLSILSNLNSGGSQVLALMQVAIFLPGIEISIPLGHFAVPLPKNRHAKKGTAILTEVIVHLEFPTCIQVERTTCIIQDLMEHPLALLCPATTTNGQLQQPGSNRSKANKGSDLSHFSCPSPPLLLPKITFQNKPPACKSLS